MRFIALLIAGAWVVGLTLRAHPTLAMSEETPMESRCTAEVIALHTFFEDWFTARLPDTDDAFARFSGVMADGFEIIGPDGGLTSREAILGGLRAAHGARPGIEIEIRSPRARVIGDGLCLATYEEWQTLDGVVRGWISTAVMRHDPNAPNGVVWLRVHETYRPDDRPAP